MSTCKSCNAEIVWGKHEKSGSRIPLDPEPVPNGNLIQVGAARDSGGPVVRYVRKDETPSELTERFVSHFSSCPEADTWRKQK